MQDGGANVLEALPPVSAPPPFAAPSPPTATPNADDAVAVVAASTAIPQPASATAQTAPSPAPVQIAPTSSMPPPNPQTTATTPTGPGPLMSHGSLQQAYQDPICGYLLQDPAFVAAVKRQDVGLAAAAASKTIKLNLHAIMARIKPQQNAAMASIMSGGPNPHPGPQPGVPPGPLYAGAASAAASAAGAGVLPAPLPGFSGLVGPPGVVQQGERRLSDSDPDLRFKRGGSCEPGGDMAGGAGRVRELRRGDWVIIRSANKSTDPELLGQDAWVARVEHNGWVELQVPKLGRTVKLQQRYLQLIPPQHPTVVLGPGPQPVGVPPPSRRATSDAGGMGPPGVPYMDEQGRPYKRPQLDPSVRPALPPEALPPARVASTPSRGGSSRIRDIIRAIRRELLAVEESVPWNCVVPSWKNVRPGWRRSLQRNVDSPTTTPAPTPPPPPPPAAPTPAAAAAAAAAAAPPGGAVGFGGADGAAAAAVSALVGSTAASILELHDALTTEKGHGLFARRGMWETRLRELADGGNNHVCLQVLWAEMAEGIKVWMAAGGPPPGTPSGAAGPGLPLPDRSSVMPPYRSYDAVAAERGGDLYGGGQTPRDAYGVARLLDKSMPLGEDDYYMAAAQQHQQQQQNMQPLSSPFFDYSAVAAGAPHGSARAAPPSSSGRGAGAPPVTPWAVRSELTLLMQSLESEVDTDLDEGADATDVEDSDAETTSAARRRRQPLPAPPADAEAAKVPEATVAAAAAAGGGEAMDVDGAETAAGRAGQAVAAGEGGKAVPADSREGAAPPGTAAMAVLEEASAAAAVAEVADTMI